jgi:hypothetical protein
MPSLTLLDVAKLTAGDASIGLIEENLKYSPEVQLFPSSMPIKGTSYQTVVRTGLPTVSFRAGSEGLTPTKSSFRNDLVQCFILGAQIEADKAIADAHPQGAAYWQGVEASGVMKAALQKLGTQIWYGQHATQGDAKGFPGIKTFCAKGALTDGGDALTIDATGTTADTASSVYLVKFGPQAVQLVPGNGATLTLGDWRVQQIVAANNGKMTAYVNSLDAWMGLQIGNQNCVRRILNLTADSGKGLTDALLARALATFPVGMMPDAIFMSRRSRSQLQTARTVVLQGQGTQRPQQPNVAPIPTEHDGVPIYATDSIGNTDAIE